MASDDDDLEAILAAQIADLAPGAAPAAPAETTRPPLHTIADPRFMRLVETRVRADLVPSRELPRWAGELPFHLDPVAWRTGFLEVSEGGPPLSIREGMQESVPQANLRDLFRPIYSEEPVEREQHDLRLDPGAREATAVLREARRHEPIPHIEALIPLLDAHEARWRSFVNEPWKPFLADDAPRRPVFVSIEPSRSR